MSDPGSAGTPTAQEYHAMIALLEAEITSCCGGAIATNDECGGCRQSQRIVRLLTHAAWLQERWGERLNEELADADRRIRESREEKASLQRDFDTLTRNEAACGRLVDELRGQIRSLIEARPWTG